MAVTPITALPTPPSKSNPANFSTAADTFLGALPTFVTEANTLAREIEDFANMSITAGGSHITALSTTSLTVGTGSKSLTASTGKDFVTGQTVKIWNLANSVGMLGTIQSYNSNTGAMTVDVLSIVGSGTFADWTLFTVPLVLNEIPASPTEAQEAYPVTLGALLDNLGTANRFCPLGADTKVPALNLDMAVEGDIFGGSTTKIMNPAVATALSYAVASVYGHGECTLTKSGSNLILQRVRLGRMYFNGTPTTIPVAGVTLSPSGLSADTTYLIYAYLNESTVTLEASATAWTADATTGIPIKTGDASRVLVGMARTTAETAWADSETQRYVLSYYNRKEKVAQGMLTAEVNITSATPVELSSSARAYFLCWGDELVFISGAAHPANGTTSVISYFLGVDGLTTFAYAGSISGFSGGLRQALAIPKKGQILSEGLHYITPVAYTSAGTANFLYTTVAPTIVTAYIKG